MKKCICEICVCGRHRCPHRPQAWTQRSSNLGQCVLSEYKQTYKQFDIRPRQSFKPKEKPLASTGKLETKTTNRCDYVAHRPVPRLSFGHVGEYVKSSDLMEGETEYMREYPEKLVSPPSPVRKREVSKPAQKDISPFQGATTHREDYRAWALQTVARDNFKQFRAYTPPKEKFEAQSTFQHDFKADSSFSPREMMKPIHAVIMSSAPFDDTTTNRVDYKAPAMGPRVLVKRTQPYIGTREKFNAITTNRKDFVSHTGIERPKCAKPALEIVKSSEPFTSNTTHNMSYIPWQLQPRFEYPRQEYYPSPEKFDHISTNQSDYQDFGQVERAVPRTREPPSHEPPPFSGVTTQRLDYQPWAVQLRDRLVKQENAYKPLQGPFEGQSTFQAHFQAKYAPPAVSAKPRETRIESSSQFDGSTIYRNTYTYKETSPCPASLLRDSYTPPVKDRYVFSHQTGTGHKFYEPPTDKKQRLSKSMPEMTSHAYS